VGTFEIGPLQITTTLVNHPVETFGLRISHGGRTLVYSSDTAESDALVELAKGADVFLCEASFLDSQDNVPDLHLTGREAGEHATRAGVRRLLLTHLVAAWGDEAQTLAEAQCAYAGPVEVVHCDAAYDI
jgi:ribonuclease BN (tRNA processing enzyme)